MPHADRERSTLMDLFDTHCHLDVDAFDPDRAAVIGRARAAGISDQLIPAIEAATWDGLRDACAGIEGLHPAYGLHPLLLSSHCEAHLALLREWIEAERPRAVGECGLDFHDPSLDRNRQLWLLDAQLAIAREFELPVVLHARGAVDAVIAAIKRFPGLTGIVHSFAGSPDQARALHRLGMLIGIGGPVTYPRARRLRSIVATLPIEQLVLETDSPDQPVCGRQGERNEPACLTRILEEVARLRNEDPGELASATSANARALLGLVTPSAGAIDFLV